MVQRNEGLHGNDVGICRMYIAPTMKNKWKEKEHKRDEGDGCIYIYI